MVDACKRYNAELCFSSSWYIDEGSEKFGFRDYFQSEDKIVKWSALAIRRYITRTVTNIIGELSTVLFDGVRLRELADRLEMIFDHRPLKGLTDVAIFFHFLTRGDVAYVNTPLTSYRRNALSNSNPEFNPNYLYTITDWAEIVKAAASQAWLDPDELREAQANYNRKILREMDRLPVWRESLQATMFPDLPVKLGEGATTMQVPEKLRCDYSQRDEQFDLLVSEQSTTRNMNIAIVSTMDEVSWGGSEELWLRMAETALDEGCQVNTLTTFWPEVPHKLQQLEKRGARLAFQMIPRRMPNRVSRYYRMLLKLVRRVACRDRFKHFEQLTHWKPDVICVSMGAAYEFLRFPGLAAYFESTSVPFVLVAQYADDVWIPQWPKQVARVCRIFERASRVVFVSQRNQRDVERHLARRIPNAIVVQNPVDLSDVNFLPWPQTQELSLASVARLRSRAKGQDVLLEALSRPEWRDRSWKLNFYGAGPERFYFESLAELYGIRDHVCFHGHVNCIRNIWALNHLLVLSSRGEGTPLALLEAQICGRPALVTDVGGNAEWVEEGVSGFIADGPNPNSVARALERAWQHRDQWESMGWQAYEKAIRKIDRDPGKTLFSTVLAAAGEHSNKSGSSPNTG